VPLLIEFALLAVFLNMANEGLGKLFGEFVASWGGIIVVFLGGALISSWLIAENSFLANHSYLILVAQLAMITIYTGMIVGEMAFQGGPGEGFGWFVGTSIAAGLGYWLFAYIQSNFLAGEIGKPETMPAFYTQLGLSSTGFNDTRVSSAAIREISLGHTALLLAAVAFVVSMVSAIVFESFARPGLSYAQKPAYRRSRR
jgi:hypothetical protein